MNFKKYHVSKNLFDEEYPNIDGTVRYRALNLGNGTYTLSSTVEISQGSAGTLFFLAGNVSSGASTATNAVYKDRPITVTSTDGYVTIAYRTYTTDTPVGKETMLNTGTTALPYEPYSSEVWHDIPYYIHNTSTDTLTTLPAVIYPTGTTATVGLKGQTTQSSIPSPTSPVMPQGTGERTANLWDEEYPNISETIRYIPLYVGEGSFTLSTTTPYVAGVANVFLLSGNVSSGASTPNNGAWLKHKVTAQSDDGYVTIAYRHYTGTTSPVDFQTMLNTGSTPLPYEKFGYKIPISSANTTTPVYLGEVETTRKIKKLILTGTENIKSRTGFLYVATNDTASYSASARCICTHYPQEGTEYCINTTNQIRFYVNSDVDTFKAYLAAQYAAGTPVTVWYVLAEPTTGIVNEPLMKIGDYADTVSGITIPTIAGTNTLSVDTTLQPSEVTVNYHGWHPVSAVHERENGAWT